MYRRGGIGALKTHGGCGIGYIEMNEGESGFDIRCRVCNCYIGVSGHYHRMTCEYCDKLDSTEQFSIFVDRNWFPNLWKKIRREWELNGRNYKESVK